MKNIHIFPTDKPSRLVGSRLNLSLKDIPISGFDAFKTYNIYITNSEEIKKGDWILNLHNKQVVKSYAVEGIRSDYKKIILTTDQDLIADGIQAIDDEFLEWFVKNPSCEWVLVGTEIWNDGTWNYFLPKEEPKFESSIENTINIMSMANSMFGKKEEPKLQCKDCNDNLTDCTCIEDTIDMKQEKLEEVAKNATKMYVNEREKQTVYLSFIEGAKWQQERMYSEEEVENIIMKLMSEVHNGDITHGDYVIDFKLSSREWFKRNKK